MHKKCKCIFFGGVFFGVGGELDGVWLVRVEDFFLRVGIFYWGSGVNW